jgi:hypothetical protein
MEDEKIPLDTFSRETCDFFCSTIFHPQYLPQNRKSPVEISIFIACFVFVSISFFFSSQRKSKLLWINCVSEQITRETNVSAKFFHVSTRTTPCGPRLLTLPTSRPRAQLPHPPPSVREPPAYRLNPVVNFYHSQQNTQQQYFPQQRETTTTHTCCHTCA